MIGHVTIVDERHEWLTENSHLQHKVFALSLIYF